MCPPPPKPTAPELGGDAVQALQRELRAWFERIARDLPWRRTRDPYRIWISEAMLQQTRVDTVIPYYQRFLERFPTVQSLADAPEEDVLKQWEGLGYYSRARNLRRAAQQVVADHDGRLPRGERELAALPGVGPYTVGAIRSIAFRERAALVDGNVTRVLSRVTAQTALSSRALWELADHLVPERRPDIFNQALMELGATVCTPRAPRCGECPIRPWCAAAATSEPERYPAPRARPAPRIVRAVGAVVIRARPRALLLLRRPSAGLLGGLWQIPTQDGAPPAALCASVEEQSGLSLEARGSVGAVRHVFSHRDLHLDLVELRARPGTSSRLRPVGHPAGEIRWCSSRQIAELPLSRLMHKVLEQIEAACLGLPMESPTKLR